MGKSTFHRRDFVVAAALGAAGVAAPALWAQGKLEKTRVLLAVDGATTLNYLPLTIAEQLGYFKAEGLELEIVEATGVGPTALVGGAADVFLGAFEHTIGLQSKNQFYQAFVLQGRAPQVAVGVSTRSLPGYQSLNDLRGRKIGVSALGSPAQMVANVLLARAGIDPSGMRFVEVGSGAGALQALRLGQIDVLSNADPVMSMLEHKGEVRLIADTRTLKGSLALFGGAMPGVCLYAALDFIRAHPNTVQALANAFVHGLKWLQTAGPSDLVQIVPEAYFLGDRALYLSAFSKVREAMSLDGLVAEDAPRTARKALDSFDPLVRASRIDLAKTYTNEFARRAKERFRA